MAVARRIRAGTLMVNGGMLERARRPLRRLPPERGRPGERRRRLRGVPRGEGHGPAGDGHRLRSPRSRPLLDDIGPRPSGVQKALLVGPDLFAGRARSHGLAPGLIGVAIDEDQLGDNIEIDAVVLPVGHVTTEQTAASVGQRRGHLAAGDRHLAGLDDAERCGCVARSSYYC